MNVNKINTGISTNRKMNDETYALKRKVMNIIYEAKKLLNNNMPRISVRIVDANSDNKDVLGVALLGKNIIWIMADTVNMSSDRLREVVYHELVHAVYGVTHSENCELMGKYNNKVPLTKAVIHRIFKAYHNSRG